MSRLAANPAAAFHLSLRMVELAGQSLATGNGDGQCAALLEYPPVRETLRLRQTSSTGMRMKTLLRHVSAVLYPAFCSVTASGLFMRPAAARSSASASHPSKSTPDLPGTPITPRCGLRLPSKSSSESTPKRFLRTLRKCRASALGSMAHSLNGDPIKFGKFNKRRHDHVSEQSQPHRLSRQ